MQVSLSVYAAAAAGLTYWFEKTYGFRVSTRSTSVSCLCWSIGTAWSAYCSWMKTLHYAGTSIRISDGLATAFQAYLVALRFKAAPSEWYSLPCYVNGSDRQTRVDIQLVPNVPIIIAPLLDELADPAGSADAVAELEAWTAHWVDVSGVRYEEGTSDLDMLESRAD
jgi:hypothetical protein